MKPWDTSVAAIAVATSLWAGDANTAEQPTPQIDKTAARVIALADTYVAEFARSFPEQAMFSGMTLPHHDGLTDNSLAALAHWQALEDSWSAELAKWPRSGSLPARSLHSHR